jgi:hypothetical protein
MKYLILLFSVTAFAQTEPTFQGHKHHKPPLDPAIAITSASAAKTAWSPGDCSDEEFWVPETGMCKPRPSEQDFEHIMVHGNGFLVGTSESGSRGVNKLASPNMLMADWGGTLAADHYFEGELMMTFEKWTFPNSGYPELLQVGEARANGSPYYDFQHPHSSPIMGIGLSDTVRQSDGNLWRFRFSPRGASTDGPVAFMHRKTGVVNPDAPLGHHIGQDVGHISSTVIAVSHYLGNNIFEVSGFHGEEPEPTKVDLPLGKIDSFALRYTRYFNKQLFAMASLAYVTADHRQQSLAETQDQSLDSYGWKSAQRLSASVYYQSKMGTWDVHRSLILGELHSNGFKTDQFSFLYEVTFAKKAHEIWSRIEILQRFPIQLGISAKETPPFHSKWIEVLTLGYTHSIQQFDGAELKAGLSGTIDILANAFTPTYGSLPVTGRAFIQIAGMKMWGME